MAKVKKCKKCSQSDSVAGIEDVKWAEMISATVAAIVANKVDNMLVQNADGTAKTEGYFVENPMAKNAMFAALGVGLASYMQDEYSQGAAIGLFAYGAYGLTMQLMDKYATPTVSGMYSKNGVYGLGNLVSMPPRNISGISQNADPRFIVGNYGVQQPIINGVDDREPIKEEIFESAMESGL